MTALHQLCLNQFEPQQYATLLQAIVCGQNLALPEFKDPLVKAGVIHLFVVSGGHLVFLAEWLDRSTRLFKYRLPFIAVYFVLILYGFVAGFQPPIVRGLLLLGLSKLVVLLRLNWPEVLLQLLCGCIALVFIDTDAQRLSLIMSWQASLALRLLAKKSELIKATGIYLAMMPVLSLFQLTSPFSILMNLILVPLFSWIILPLSILSTFFEVLQTHVLPFLFKSLFAFLGAVDFLLEPLPIAGVQASMSLVLAYLIYMHIMLHDDKLRDET
jgi:competence protein ComEC